MENPAAEKASWLKKEDEKSLRELQELREEVVNNWLKQRGIVSLEGWSFDPLPWSYRLRELIVSCVDAASEKEFLTNNDLMVAFNDDTSNALDPPRATEFGKVLKSLARIAPDAVLLHFRKDHTLLLRLLCWVEIVQELRTAVEQLIYKDKKAVLDRMLAQCIAFLMMQNWTPLQPMGDMFDLLEVAIQQADDDNLKLPFQAPLDLLPKEGFLSLLGRMLESLQHNITDPRLVEQVILVLKWLPCRFLAKEDPEGLSTRWPHIFYILSNIEKFYSAMKKVQFLRILVLINGFWEQGLQNALGDVMQSYTNMLLDSTPYNDITCSAILSLLTKASSVPQLQAGVLLPCAPRVEEILHQESHRESSTPRPAKFPFVVQLGRLIAPSDTAFCQRLPQLSVKERLLPGIQPQNIKSKKPPESSRSSEKARKEAEIRARLLEIEIAIEKEKTDKARLKEN